MTLDPLAILVLQSLVKSIVVIVVLLTAFAYLTLVERLVIARIQVRIGPNRVGPRGLLQPIADALKMIFKEDIIPAQADKLVYIVAPGLAVGTALLAWAVIPLNPSVTIGGYKIDFYVADVNVAVLYLLAIGSLGVYGIVLGGWSSNNKYSLLGSLRSTAQMISYEISLGLALVGVLMVSGTLSLVQIVQQQSTFWNVLWQPLGFVIYLICAVAEVNRLPFDLPEAETELVAGYQTEYASLKFALFYMAEYINMLTVSAIAATMFLGGYQGPFGILPGIHWLIIKIAFFIFLLMWMRGTLPRFRYDQLMSFGWKVLLPLALANIFVTAVVMVLLGR
ncbi:MAG: NADH-quinone oxidoreductase subunit NuoH [Chloroflexi bacterium]|nr:NADH-quinone oxidoreductase subunit NuoH [Chloroflexota bacterium]